MAPVTEHPLVERRRQVSDTTAKEVSMGNLGNISMGSWRGLPSWEVMGTSGRKDFSS